MAKKRHSTPKRIQRPTSTGRTKAKTSRSLNAPQGRGRQPTRPQSSKPRRPKVKPAGRTKGKPAGKSGTGRSSKSDKEWYKLIQAEAKKSGKSKPGSKRKPSTQDWYKLFQEAAEKPGRRPTATGGPRRKSVKRKVAGKGKPRKRKAPTRLKDLVAEDQRRYRNLYQRVYRLKQKVAELNMKKRGSKAKRSELYKQIIEVNRELKKLFREAGMKVRKLEGVLRERESAGEVIRYTEVVWKFEPIFTGYVNNRTFDKIVFLNSGKTMYASRSKPSTILAEYDGQREMAYFRIAATTPLVNVTEDYGNSTISLEFVS